MTTVASAKKRLESIERWVAVLKRGLAGKPDSIGSDAGDAFEKCMRKLGFRVLSKTAAAKEGLELRRNAQPIVWRDYKRPISSTHPLYLVEQFKPKKTADSLGATSQ